MDLGEKVRERRNELGLTQEELAKRMGYSSRVSINKIENGRPVSQKIIVRLAKALNVEVSYLMGWEDQMKALPIYELSKVKLPMLGNIACGEPIYADEQHESYVMAGTNIHADFCLRAQGDSMTGARINDGDIVFIQQTPKVPDGTIAAVLIDDEATLKRFYYYENKNMVVLKAENPAYKDLIYMDDEIAKIRVLGKAVAFQSDIK